MNVDDFPTPDADVETVAPATVTHSIDAGEDAHDVRMGSEYEEWHIDDAVEHRLGSNNCAASQESLAGD